MHSSNAGLDPAASTLSRIAMEMDAREPGMKVGWKGKELPDLNTAETELRLGLGPQEPQKKEPPKDDASYRPAHNTSLLRWQAHHTQAMAQIADLQDGRAKHTVPAKRGFLQALGAPPSSQIGFPMVLSPNVGSSAGVTVHAARPTPPPTVVAMAAESEVAMKPSPSLPYAWSNRPSTPLAMPPKAAMDDIGSSLRAPPPVVGWPPVRSFRKNTITAAAPAVKQSSDEEERPRTVAATPLDATTASSSATFFVKVNMDGVPIGRKIDLKAYVSYEGLKLALQSMFQFINGSNVTSEVKQLDLLQGREYVLTHEDKDGDWMLVGDVPWEMFVSTVKRLRIMKATQGVFPGQVQKC